MSYCFGFRRPESGFTLWFKMLGGSEVRLRRGFACGKTLVRRKIAAGQKAGWVVLLYLLIFECSGQRFRLHFFVNTGQKGRTSDWKSFLFSFLECTAQRDTHHFPALPLFFRLELHRPVNDPAGGLLLGQEGELLRPVPGDEGEHVGIHPETGSRHL